MVKHRWYLTLQMSNYVVLIDTYSVQNDSEKNFTRKVKRTSKLINMYDIQCQRETR